MKFQGARHLRNARGYTMVALMIGMTVMSILIAAVLPLASAERQRDREAELIFRGRQYAEGIRCYRRRYGRPPNALKEMMEARPRTLRKLWKDPMTDSEDWGLITVLTGQPIVADPRGGSKGGDKGGDKGGEKNPRPTATPSPTPAVGIFGDKPPGAGGQVGPILGVYSHSKKKGYGMWNGQEIYEEWRFDEASLAGQNGQQQQPGPGGIK
ncbi:MAG: type II secretion system protein [Thermoanaerobaculia bacterium]